MLVHAASCPSKGTGDPGRAAPVSPPCQAGFSCQQGQGLLSVPALARQWCSAHQEPGKGLPWSASHSLSQAAGSIHHHSLQAVGGGGGRRVPLIFV